MNPIEMSSRRDRAIKSAVLWLLSKRPPIQRLQVSLDMATCIQSYFLPEYGDLKCLMSNRTDQPGS
jgi:hypothetical protein